ncbi:short transient receptor potential channel 6-like [Babylonia areolata]|uniref:short transient receptor potential channel 6-like n=1 Tax=Babylonia areolata TaxID=304850 RepID=UPI003FD3CAB4
MSRTSFTRRFSFNAGRKNSREHKQHPNKDHHQYQHQQHPTDHNSLQDKRQHSRRENPDVEKVARGIFGDVPLTDTERRFLSAADTGHLSALEQCVEESGALNVNCRDYLGRTALQLAVLGEHYDCISYLLQKSSPDTIEEALLHAIKKENVKICDMVLSHPIYSSTVDQSSARMPVENTQLVGGGVGSGSGSGSGGPGALYEKEDSNSSFAPDITPIVLAAQCNNFDIVHMLIQKGFTIKRPHHYFCFCTDCSIHKTIDRFVHSRSRLNAYRGLASTAYLSLSCDDPILTAFELSKSLHVLAETEKEYKNEYRSLSESCKCYAVDLLDLCRSNEEVMAALHGGSDTKDLSRIRMAIRYEQKKFIAHASCQEHLMSMWYAGVPWFQHQPFTMKLFLLPLGIVFIPVTAIIYVFLPYSRVGEVLRSPFMKFVNYICSYTAFLVLLFFATTLTTTDNSPHNVDLFTGTDGVVNSLIMFYVLGMFWAECKQLWEEGVKGYFSQMWNYMDITMLALYTAAYAIEGVIYTKVTPFFLSSFLPSSDDDGIPDPQILSRVLFSVANVMSFARIAYILPASETFGQLQISYGRMLQDVAKFIFIYFTVMIAFICGLTSLYSLSPDNRHFENLAKTTGTLFWAAFGMGNSAAPEIKAGGRHNMVEMIGYVLYGVYILVAVVVLINMLIAMMSNTFEEIQTCEDIEWKFARAKLWISFIEEGTTLPIPFNIVPTPKSILRLAASSKHALMGCSKDAEISGDEDGLVSLDYKVNIFAIMHKVVLRYVHKMKFDKKGDSLKEDLLDAKEELLAQTYNMCSALHMRLDHVERHLFSLTSTRRNSKYDDVTSLTSAALPVTPTSNFSGGFALTNNNNTVTTSNYNNNYANPWR